MASPIPGLGARFREAREMVPGLSSRELDRLAGRTEGHAAAIEANQSDRNISTMRDFCRALGISLDWLVMGRGAEPQPKTVQDAVAAARVRVEQAEQRSA